MRTGPSPRADAFVHIDIEVKGKIKLEPVYPSYAVEQFIEKEHFFSLNYSKRKQ